jgi:hypothetical protein
MTSDERDRPTYASPPCFAHEVDPKYMGYEAAPVQTDVDVAHWRKAKRAELIAARLKIPASERKSIVEEVAGVLDGLIDFGPGTIIGLYWPFRGELNLSGWMKSAHE